MTGTPNQIFWPELIKVQIDQEFDRVSNALSTHNRPNILALLEEKRGEVMANDRARYFIMAWGELNGQVTFMITADPRFHAQGNLNEPSLDERLLSRMPPLQVDRISRSRREELH
jgi:hypothetical protein